MLAVGVGQNNVKLTVTRDGLFGDVDVYWQSGSNDSSLRDGSISPSQGVLRFVHDEQSKTFSVRVLSLCRCDPVGDRVCACHDLSPLQADPSTPHGVSEIFLVRLTATFTVAQGGVTIDQNRNRAAIEPHGVIGFATSSQSVRVTEGVDNKVRN